jgi:tetratricopeptide (TPR) repeat protein
MKNRPVSAKVAAATLLMAAILLNSTPAYAQGELIPVSDITGGSGIFVMRPGGPRGFVSRVKAKPTKSQRIEVAKRVSRQYVRLAKVAPRRTRTTAIMPNDPRLAKVKEMPRDEASKVFAGLGEYHLDRDDYNQAIDIFREALTLDPKNSIAGTGLSEALALKGNELLVKDSFPVAKTFFEEALKYNPKNAPAYFGLAEVLTEMDQEGDAANNYELALMNDKELSEIYVPLGTLYYRAGEIAKADERLSKAVAGSPNDAQANFYLGLVRFTQNKNDEALTLLRKASTLDATNAEAFYYLGETLSRLNRYQEASVEYNKAVLLRDAYFEAWLNLGTAEYKLGNYPSAVKAYQKAVRLKNDNFVAYNNLGDSFRQIGDFNQAESNYNLAALFIQRQPTFDKEDAADMYSKAAFSIAKQCEINIKMAAPCRWDDAVRALEAADKLSTTGVDAANLGWAYYNAARADIHWARNDAAKPKLEKAKLNLQRAAAGNSKFVSGPMLNLGMALADLGEYPAAIEALKKVIEKEPKWIFAINELGMAYFKQGNYKDAVEQFKKATDKDGKFAQGYYNLAMANFKNGNVADAGKNLETLNKLGKSDASAKNLAAKLVVATNGMVRAGS